jgi:DNA polymerase-3 subunit delta'
VSAVEAGLPEALAAALEHQPRARMALGAALSTGPSHAYLFEGSRGSGKRAAARAFSAEIIAAGSEDPGEARRRVLLDPSPHPDLVWLEPRGAQHLIEEVRERVIRAAAYRPFEGTRRVFVIEAAEALRDESQNALLKTLEEPPPYAHLILLTSEPEALLETVSSRCQTVAFAPLPAAAIEAALGDAAGAEERAAAARLAAGDLGRARFLVSAPGRELREQARVCVSSALAGEADTAPWGPLLDRAEAEGAEAEGAVRARLEEERESGAARPAKEIGDEAKRAGRRRRTEVLDLGLELIGTWLRDLVAISVDAPDVAFNSDHMAELERDAAGIDPGRAREGTELVEETRRRLDLNVSEELALEALLYRLERLLAR